MYEYNSIDPDICASLDATLSIFTIKPLSLRPSSNSYTKKMKDEKTPSFLNKAFSIKSIELIESITTKTTTKTLSVPRSFPLYNESSWQYHQLARIGANNWIACDNKRSTRSPTTGQWRDQRKREGKYKLFTPAALRVL